MRFWIVSVCLTIDDNGYCVTFDNEAEAKACYVDHVEAGAWHVGLWS